MGNGYSENPTTIGAKIRNRRLELQLFQRDVAVFCGVSEDTITFWENGRTEPQVYLYPKVIEFLGYFPFDVDTSTFSSKIKEYRYRRGLNHRGMGKLIGVDASTVGNWEADKCYPREDLINTLSELLKNNT